MKNSYYFQHDYTANSDAKVLFLRQGLGMEGYGIYWFIIEQLACAGGVLPLKIVPVLAMQMQTSIEKVNAVIKGFELFEVSKNDFFSVRLNEQLDFRKMLSVKGKEGVAIREAKRAALRGASSNPSSKERKGKKEKKFIAPSVSDVVVYFTENGYSESSAKTAFNFYNVANWIDSKGNPVKNWKQKMQGVWFKPENEAAKETSLLSKFKNQEVISHEDFYGTNR